MKDIIFTVAVSCLTLFCYGQTSRFAVSGHYGLVGNFFVRSYDEAGGPAVPDKMFFYKKNFIGSIGGAELRYNVTANSGIGIAYSRAINKGRKNFEGQSGNVQVVIKDFQLRHTSDFFQLYYERTFTRKNPAWKYHAGLLYARTQQQEIDYFPDLILLDERNFKNSRLEEGGVFAGVQYAKRVDNHFYFGVKARVYYLISVLELEAVTLTPVLIYHF